MSVFTTAEALFNKILELVKVDGVPEVNRATDLREAYKHLIDTLFAIQQGTLKVADIINNLDSNEDKKGLSALQGKILNTVKADKEALDILSDFANLLADQLTQKIDRSGDVLSGQYLFQENEEAGLGLSSYGLSFFNGPNYTDISYGATSGDGIIIIYNGNTRNFLGFSDNSIKFSKLEPGAGGLATKLIFIPPTSNNNIQFPNDSGIIALTKNLASEITNTTNRANLSNANNWTAKDYTGSSSILGQKQGDYFKDSNYFYFMYTNTVPIRILRS